MIKNIFNYSLICSVIIAIVFIIATLQSKKRKDKSILYLNAFVFFFMLNNLQIVLIDNVFINANYFVRNLLIPFYALIVPAFYTFLTYYLNVENKITSFIKFTTWLFIIELLVRIILLQYYNEDKNYVVAQYSQIEEIINAFLSLFLYIKSFILLFNRNKLYENVLSFGNIKWLKTFMFLGSIILLTWICAILLNIDKVINPQIFIYYPLRLSSSALLLWLGYQGFFNYSLMTERMQLRKAIATNKKSIISDVSKIKSENKFQNLNTYILDNKRYTDANFSLENLANEMNMSTSSVSSLINQSSNQNFSDYINSLRVEEAKKYLIEPDYVDYTIIAIGLECGFYSKSTFYAAFKKFTNTTPTEFKKQTT